MKVWTALSRGRQ